MGFFKRKVKKNKKVEYKNIDASEHNWMHPVNSFDVIVDNKKVGYVSIIHPKIKDKINPKENIIVAELDVNLIADTPKREISYSEVSKYQTVTFDLSLIVDKDMKYSKIEDIIKEANMKYLMGYELIDIYENAEKLLGRKTVTIRFTIGSYTDTLTKEEIDQERDTVLKTLNSNNVYIVK